MPIRVVQSNDRVSEVQLICDCCGKPLMTRIVANEEIQTPQNKDSQCWQCRQK